MKKKEVTNKSHRKATFFLTLISIMIIVLVGVGGWYFGLEFVSRKEETKEVDKSQNEVKLEKIEEDKEYVYDANYEYENKYKSYNTYEDSNKSVIINDVIEVEYSTKKQLFSNLKVPFINIKSESADKINEQLKNLYLEYAASFDTNGKNKSSNAPLPIEKHILTYTHDISDNLLSVVIVSGKTSTDTWELKYMPYVFNLKTGSALSYKGVLSMLNYTHEGVLERLVPLIDEKIETLASEHKKNLSAEKKEKYANEAKERFIKSVEENKALCFVEEGKLIVLEQIEYGDGTSNYYRFEIIP